MPRPINSYPGIESMCPPGTGTTVLNKPRAFAPACPLLADKGGVEHLYTRINTFFGRTCSPYRL